MTDTLESNVNAIAKDLEDALFYKRASTSDQTTIQQEEEAILKTKDKFNLKWIITDDGVSGSKRDRPGLNEAQAIWRSGKCKVVVVNHITRLGRSFEHIVDLVQEFRNLGIRFISLKDNIDTADDTAYTRAYLRLMSTFAELQREMIIENTNSKLQSYKRQIAEKGFYITKTGVKKTSLGRPCGSKDGSGVVRSSHKYYKSFNPKRAKKGVRNGTD